MPKRELLLWFLIQQTYFNVSEIKRLGNLQNTEQIVQYFLASKPLPPLVFGVQQYIEHITLLFVRMLLSLRNEIARCRFEILRFVVQRDVAPGMEKSPKRLYGIVVSTLHRPSHCQQKAPVLPPHELEIRRKF